MWVMHGGMWDVGYLFLYGGGIIGVCDRSRGVVIGSRRVHREGNDGPVLRNGGGMSVLCREGKGSLSIVRR